LEILGKSSDERRSIAERWKRLDFGHENDYPHALSGECASVYPSRAFATNANILLCDEPFSALDEMTARKLR
jgi:NitT/TauT family transport system ATP-binding protein